MASSSSFRFFSASATFSSISLATFSAFVFTATCLVSSFRFSRVTFQAWSSISLCISAACSCTASCHLASAASIASFNFAASSWASCCSFLALASALVNSSADFFAFLSTYITCNLAAAESLIASWACTMWLSCCRWAWMESSNFLRRSLTAASSRSSMSLASEDEFAWALSSEMWSLSCSSARALRSKAWASACWAAWKATWARSARLGSA
mmetsp:Transcript_60263/g.97550  ORF Transcript_60263/g.97550 Transcript_60263/m.97550 type:complete len:212 (-) Transcript_60263:111-746(-)